MSNREEIHKFFNINEINRLQRCAKNKDKKEIIKWGQAYDKFLHDKYSEAYEKQFVEWLKQASKDIDVAIIYTLHFNENLKFGKKRLQSFMDDFRETMRSIYKSEFDSEEYLKMLKEDGIDIE